MRVLLKKDATEFSPETILVLSARRRGGRAFDTLAGDATAEDAIVVPAGDRVVADVIADAARRRGGSGVTARGLFADVWRMARILAPYAQRSKVGQRWTPAGWVIDLSEATSRAGRYESTDRDSAVAWQLIDAEFPEWAGGVFDEGVAATIRRARQWRYRAAKAHRDAEIALAILTDRPLPAWVDYLHRIRRG